MIRCWTTVRRAAHRAYRGAAHVALHHPGRALAIVWVPCAVAGAGGLALVHRWPEIEAAAQPIAVPEPSMLFVWLAAGAFITLRRK